VEADPGDAFARSRLAEVRAEMGNALARLPAHAGERCAALAESVALWEALEREGKLAGESRAELEAARSLLRSCAPRAGSP
jgi:hypothetical protein